MNVNGNLYLLYGQSSFGKLGSVNDVCLFAETNFRGQRRPFGIRRADRCHHLYVIGKTGMGKSSLMENLIVSDIRAGAGFAVLDPHGDLVRRALRYVPEERRDDLIYFNPTEPQHALAFNILRDSYARPYLIVSGVLGAFKKVWGDSWGPRMEHIFRHVLLALLPYPEATLCDVPRMLLEKSFRARVLAYVDDAYVQAFFKDEFEKYASYFRSEAVAPILNKVGGFLANPMLRHILGQQENRLRFREIMDGGRIFLADLAKGALGEDSSALLGALLLSQIELATLTRSELRESERRPFYLYVDEFPSFVTSSFAGMLSEARKYGLSLTLSHQTLAQLDDKMRGAIFGNVGSLVAFQVSAEDAFFLSQEFAPTFKEQDLANLPRHHIYLKLVCGGNVSEPFSGVTLPPPWSPEAMTAPMAGLVVP